MADEVEQLIELLDTHDSHIVRARATVDLGKLRGPKVVEALLRALQDEHYLVRERAAEVLGDHGDPAALEPLKKTLLDDLEERRVREQAVGSIYRLGGTAGADALKEALKPTYFGDYPVRAIAAEALGRMGHAEAVPALIEALAEETARNFPILRKAVVGAIGAIGDPDALEPLQDTIKEIDYTRDPGEIAPTNEVVRKLESLRSESKAS